MVVMVAHEVFSHRFHLEDLSTQFARSLEQCFLFLRQLGVFRNVVVNKILSLDHLATDQATDPVIVISRVLSLNVSFHRSYI